MAYQIAIRYGIQEGGVSPFFLLFPNVCNLGSEKNTEILKEKIIEFEPSKKKMKK